MTISLHFAVQLGSFRLAAELEAPARGVTAIFGPSGSGKTTLLRTIAGLEREASGHLRIGDEVWHDDHHFVPTHRRGIGYVFQEANLFSHLSVRRNLEYGLKRTPPAARRIDVTSAVDLLGLEALLSRRPDSLSGGERQRVAMARALLCSPRVLLMDEPLASLDLDSRCEILPFLDRLHRKLEIPIIYVSHAIDEVARLADHLVLLDRGQVLAGGAIAEVLTRLDLPLACSEEAQSVVDCTVAGHDDDFGLTRLAFAGGEFTVPGTNLAPGTPVRLRILARDVSLTLEHQTGTSILNIFATSLEAVAAHGASQATVRLQAGGVPLLSRITRKSAAALDLEPGRRLYAQVKSIAVLA